MRLNRYIGQKPKFQVFRRVDGIEEDIPLAANEIRIEGTRYRRMPAFDYFVLALNDVFAPPALFTYAAAAERAHESETASDVARLADEANRRSDRKIPD